MNDLIRSLAVYADDILIGEGCPVQLSARAEASLRPLRSVVRIGALSESSRVLLRQSRKIRLCHEDAIFAEGDILDHFTAVQPFPRWDRTCSASSVLSGGSKSGADMIPVTTVIFSDTRPLADLPVSLTVPPGTDFSDMLRLLLSGSGSGLPLLHYSGVSGALTRPRTFFGPLPDALNAVAALADARVFRTPSGLVCIGKQASFESVDIPESDLLSEPMPTKDRIILSVAPKGWPLGAIARVHWKDMDFTGTVLERATEADNRSGPRFSQLVLEVKNG